MRTINPWVGIPVVLATLAGGSLGWIVTGLTCQEGCRATQFLVATGAALLAAIGVGVVAVLAVMSLEEWRETTASRREEP